MPRKLYDDDGKEVEVLTEEEIKELQAKAASNQEEIKKATAEIRGILGVDEGVDLKQAIQDAKQAANPNWAKARNRMDRLTAFIKANIKDADIDDDGNVKTAAPAMDSKGIEDLARKATRAEMLNSHISSRLARLPEDKRTAVKSYFDKLAAGEDLDIDKADGILSESLRLVFPDAKPGTSVEGLAPNFESGNQPDFADTDTGKQTAQSMGLRSINQPNDDGGKK